MKKMICVILVLMLVLTGCQTAGNKTTSTGTPSGLNPNPQEGSELNPPIGVQAGERIPFENAGKLRLEYTGNRSSILYVTSVDQLPAEGNWEGYDETYFENKALLIVVETLNSGSVQVELESVTMGKGTASITIKRTMEGNAGTSDMATWMLWAEVQKGLDCEWVLENG